MCVPYTYLIGWPKLGTYYYGVRFSKNCHPSELWVSYFTSSRHVTDFRLNNGEPSVIQVRRVFSNKETAIAWENKVLRRLKAHVHPKFLNKTNNVAICNTPEHYIRLAQFNKNRGCPEHQKKILSQKARTPERLAISRATFQKYGNQGVYEVTTPYENIVTVRGLRRFCKEIGICYSSMSSLASGNYKSNDNIKGYRIKKLGSESIVRV